MNERKCFTFRDRYFHCPAEMKQTIIPQLSVSTISMYSASPFSLTVIDLYLKSVFQSVDVE